MDYIYIKKRLKQSISAGRRLGKAKAVKEVYDHIIASEQK